jgi:hypothetical protein
VRFQGGFKWYGHSGGGPGFIAKYSYLKEHRLGYVVMSNYFNPQQFQELCKVVQSYLIQGLTPESKPAIQISNEQLQEYAGYYELKSSRMQLTKFLEILFNGVTITHENNTLYESEFMTDKKVLFGVSENKFRRIDDADASRIFITNSDQSMIYATNGSFYVKAGSWVPYIYRSLFFGALFFMLSAVVYAFIWIPVYLYKKVRKSEKISPYLRMRVVPLIAVLSLVVSIYIVSTQDLINVGQKSFANIAFSVLTLVFGGLSVLSMWIAIKSLFKPIIFFAKLYCLLLSASCFGMTLFLGYWGIIGLRLWAY